MFLKCATKHFPSIASEQTQMFGGFFGGGGDPFDDPFFGGSGRRGGGRGQQQLGPFGGMDSMMGSMMQMQQQMMQGMGGMGHGFGDDGMMQQQQSFGGMGGMGGGSSFSSSSFYSSSSSSNGGEPVVIQRSSSHVRGPDGLTESKQTYRDSRSGGSAGMRLARGIGDRRRIVQQERGRDGAIKEETRHENIDEDDRPTFDQVWRDRAARSGFRGANGSAMLRAGNSTSSGRRYLSDRSGRGMDMPRIQGRRGGLRRSREDEGYVDDDDFYDDAGPYEAPAPARRSQQQRPRRSAVIEEID